jgi:hypothetical protein
MPGVRCLRMSGVEKVRVMSQAILVLLYLVAAAILIPLIVALGFWLKGADSIVLPGLGVIIATPLLVAALVVAELGAVLGAAYCVRYLPAARTLFGGED